MHLVKYLLMKTLPLTEKKGRSHTMGEVTGVYILHGKVLTTKYD